MLSKIYSCPWVFKRHQDAPLLYERNQFLSEKHKQGLALGGLRQWENFLLYFISDFHLHDRMSIRVSLDEILKKADTRFGSLVYTNNRLKRNQVKEYYIIRAIDFLDFSGLLDERYYDTTLNIIASSKHAKISLITVPFFKERMDFIETYRLKGYKQCSLRKYAQYQLHIIDLINLKDFRIVTDEEILSAAKIWKSISAHLQNPVFIPKS